MKYHRLAIKALHEAMGHLRTERVFDLVRQKFFWPRMHADIEHFIQDVCSCVKQRRPVFQARAPLQPIITPPPVYKYDLKSHVAMACLHIIGKLFHVLAPL